MEDCLFPCGRLVFFVLLIIGSFATVLGDCSRKPPFSATRYPKSPGDNGFKIIISGDVERYEPGALYTVTLVGARTHNRLQQFTRFSLGVEPRDPNAPNTPQVTGQFQLFADTISTFDEDCVNTIKEADDLPKTEVQVMWKAPREGSGCVVIKGMVYENTRKWYQNDGQLSRLICEQTSKTPVGDKCCACDDAKYNMVFEGIWSNITHPKDFPFSLWLTHFSDVIGASHENGFSFWGEGQKASDGFRSLAEWGSVRLMEQELRAQSKHLKTIIKAGGLWYPNVNTNTSATFKVDRKRHLVSLASMLGPTPDWVVGVNGLDLCQRDCTWVTDKVVDLYPYDAGTDSGITYMSPNQETKPREKMFRITTKYPEDPRAPFYDPTKDELDYPLARLHLIRESVTPRTCDDEFLQELTLEVSENTEDTSRPECGVTEWGSWSACSVTCGKGLRMRNREYTMPPEKVRMFGCNRQIVGKEMCAANIPECEGGNLSEDNEDLSRTGGENIGADSEICRTEQWSPWSECSATCGVGFIMRNRHFINPMGIKKCTHVTVVEKDKCMSDPCPEEHSDSACPVTPWSEWSTCSVSCGQGVRVRMRISLASPENQDRCKDILELSQVTPCSERADCSLDMATAKQVCMQDSDPGVCRGSYQRWAFHREKLMCVPFTYNGCKGNRNNFLTEDECSKTCSVVRGSGKDNRCLVREVGLKMPAFNLSWRLRVTLNRIRKGHGRCDQMLHRWQIRETPACDCDAMLGGSSTSNPRLLERQFSNENENAGVRVDCMVSDWSEWSPCSVSCGAGYSESVKVVKVREQNGGTPCPRKLVKRRRCHARQCYI